MKNLCINKYISIALILILTLSFAVTIGEAGLLFYNGGNGAGLFMAAAGKYSFNSIGFDFRRGIITLTGLGSSFFSAGGFRKNTVRESHKFRSILNKLYLKGEHSCSLISADSKKRSPFVCMQVTPPLRFCHNTEISDNEPPSS